MKKKSKNKNLTEFVNAVLKNEASKAKKALSKTLAQKTLKTLKNKKKEVANDMFSSLKKKSK